MSKLSCYLYRFCLLLLRRTCCHCVTIALLLIFDSFTLSLGLLNDYCLIFFQLIKSASEYCSSYAMHHVLHICIKSSNGVQIDRCYLMSQNRAWWLVKISNETSYTEFFLGIRQWWGHSQYSRPTLKSDPVSKAVYGLNSVNRTLCGSCIRKDNLCWNARMWENYLGLVSTF